MEFSNTRLPKPAKGIPLDGNFDSKDLSCRAMKGVDLETIRDHFSLLEIASVAQGSHCGRGVLSTGMTNAVDNARTISPDPSSAIQRCSGRTYWDSGRAGLPDLW
jgi:hypothetical protein